MRNHSEIIEASFSYLDELRGYIDIHDSKVVTHQILALKYLCLSSKHTFKVPEGVKWEKIAGSGVHIHNKVSNVFSQIEEANPSLYGVFDQNYVSKLKEDILFKLVVLIDKYGPNINEINNTDFVATYTEELMSAYIKNGGKRGDLHTPDELGTLLVQLIQPQKGTVNDGAAGIGDLLVKSKQFSNKVTLFGQEINNESWILAKINFILHGYSTEEANVLKGNTLTNPLWLEDDELKKFDYVLMNPPFGLRDWGYDKNEPDKYRRFDYGVPGKTNGEMAFILHMIASLNERGKGAVIIPHGVLFRGGIEQKIRQAIIKADLLEAVISLPSNLFYGTGLPVVILIFNRSKTSERKGQVQFINAESGFAKRRTIHILRKQDIEKIVDTYLNNEERDMFSRFVPISEIQDSDNRWTPNLYFQKVEVKTEFGVFEVDRKKYEKHPQQKVALEEVATVYRGINPPVKKSSGEGVKVKVIQLKDIQDGQILFSELDEMIVEDMDRALNYKIYPGDVILSSRGTAFKVAIVPEHKGDILLSNMFLGIRADDSESIYPPYIQSFFESPIGMQYLESYQSGSVVTVLSYKDVEKILIPLLSYEKQQEIADGITKAEAEYLHMLEEAKQAYREKVKKHYKTMTIVDAIEDF